MKLIIRNDDINHTTTIDNIKKMMSLSDNYIQTLSIIPFYNNCNKTSAIWNETNILEYIEQNKIPYALHGIIHENVNGQYEFVHYGEEYKKYIRHMLTKIEKSSFKSNVFVPPHNYLDFRWESVLKEFGYNIISSTKRQFDSVENSKECRCGTIKRNGLYYIPQTVMIRKKDFDHFDNYFDALEMIIEENESKLRDIVITIHGYEILNDKKFFGEMKRFLKKMERKGVENANFKDYIDNEEYMFDKEIFYSIREKKYD